MDSVARQGSATKAQLVVYVGRGRGRYEGGMRDGWERALKCPPKTAAPKVGCGVTLDS